MRKRVLAVLLCAALVWALLPSEPAVAEERLSFISINDTMPQELVNCVVTYNGMIYVPYTVFANYGLGISYVYFSSASTAYLYTGDKQLFFELISGKTYDGLDNMYSAPAIMQAGTVYLPLSTMYWFFGGFSYSNIPGSEYGSILRITTDAAVLTDEEFARAAKNTIKNYYYSYYQAQGQTAETPTAAPADSGRPEPGETPGKHEGERVILSFAGLPEPRLLDYLNQSGIRACFFLTAEEVREHADLVRRIAGEGHALGAYLSGEEPETQWREISALLFEAARVKSLLIAPVPGYEAACRALAESEELVCCGNDYPGAENGPVYAFQVTAWLENAGEGMTLRVGCGTNDWVGITEVLRYLISEKMELVCPRETLPG